MKPKGRHALTASAALAWAFASSFIMLDTWAVRKSGEDFSLVMEEKREETPPEDTAARPSAETLRRLATLASWDGVLLKRAADASLTEARNPGGAQETEEYYLRALRLAPGHYLTSWALGSRIFERAPEGEAWEDAYRGTLRLFPVHEALRRDFIARLCRQALAAAKRGDAAGARARLHRAEELGALPYWLPLARGAALLVEGDASAWRAFREAIHDAAAPPAKEGLLEHAARYFRSEGARAAREARWDAARRWFDLAGACEPDIAAFLRELDALYAHRRAEIWGVRPSVVVEDFSTGEFEAWRGGGRLEAETRPGRDADGREWREAALSPEAMKQGGSAAYWTRARWRFHPGDKIDISADIWTSGCVSPPESGVAMYLRLETAAGGKGTRNVIYGKIASSVRDLGGGWRHVTFADAAARTASQHTFVRADVLWVGPSVTTPCAVVRVSGLAVGLAP